MEKQKKSYNTVEKISFTLGILVLFTLVSFLIYQMSQRKENPPILKVTIVEELLTNNYDYIVEIENIGEETAESANIKLSLYQDGKAVEEGTVNLQYIPVKSKRTAWIVFQTKRKIGDSVAVSSITYVKP